MLRAHCVAALIAALTVLLPASAGATWGNKCSLGSTHHCYAIAEWAMSGTGNGGGEEVKGLSSEIMTTAMSVPQWQSRDFVDDEQWMTAPSGRWVEDGQTSGNAIDCCSLHWFYAYQNGVYNEYVAPWTYEGWTWISYTLSDPENNGSWCEKIGAVQVACQGGFSKYATLVQVGMEAADEQQPENAGKDRTGVQHLDGNWYHWNGAEWVTQDYNGDAEGSYVCAKGFEAIAGYINFGTPANKC